LYLCLCNLFIKSKINIKPFDGEEYAICKFRVRALLSENDSIKVLDETGGEVTNEIAVENTDE